MIRRVNSVIAIIICAIFLFYVTPVFTKAESDAYVMQEQESGIQPLSIREIISKYSDDYCEVKLKVTFEREVNPPPTFSYSKVRNEKTYQGNLGIESIERRNDVTDAIYSGKLY